VGAPVAVRLDLGRPETVRLTEHARASRELWNAWAPGWTAEYEDYWASDEPVWGNWDVPEADLRVLDEVEGKDVLELACGSARWSAWLTRRGARLVALDHSERQLEGLGRLQQKFGVDFTLVHASAEDVPLPDESFDLVLSEYGVSLWCDPELWVPEAARVLRPGGRLVFVGESPFVVMCLSDDGSALTTSLLRPYFNLYPLPWPGSDSLQFGLGYGGWIQLLGANGLAVDTLTEVLAPEGGDPGRWDYLNADWGRRQWPTELIWTARKQR
jgi:SAM-dependent methyltransferase